MKKQFKVMNIVGARPNFMKMAPLYRVYAKHTAFIQPILVHTGQHSESNMSAVFIKEFQLKKPDYMLKVNAGTTVSWIAEAMKGLEKIINIERPDAIVVVGDVNSTLAAALTAKKMGVKLIHIEAGLRSGNLSMPEEINRILVDHMSDALFVTEKAGMENLRNENVGGRNTFFVGNVMIDNLVHMLPAVGKSDILERIGVTADGYAIITMHRPSNVDTRERLQYVLRLVRIAVLASNKKIVFPVHPRTRASLDKFGMTSRLARLRGVICTDPLGYTDFMKLVKECSFILTDSGGIQEEAAYLKVPTITLRESTERPSTIACGANILYSPRKIRGFSAAILATDRRRKSIRRVPLNDGKAAERIVNILCAKLRKQ